MIQDQEQIQRRLAALTTVQDMALELTSELDVKQLLHKILDSAIQVSEASTGSLLLWDPKTDELVFVVTRSQELLNYRMPADKGIAGWVFTHCEPSIVSDVSQDDRFFETVDHDSHFHTQSLITVPLMNATERIGVIQVLNKESGEQFDEQDRDILIALAAQATTSIINARLYQELETEKNRISAVWDQARQKLARDLHDGPAQILASMIMDIEFILKLYEHEPGRVPDELQKLRETAQKTLAQVRNTMFELRPLVLETQGFKDALETYTERLVKTEGMNIHLDIRNLEGRLPSRIEELCFAIMQEAVSNVKKHAQAKNTWIIVERRTKDLVIAVRDDGQGFNVASTEEEYDRRGSLGLLNMKERADLLGAQYALESVPGRGTLVSLIVPLNTNTTSTPSPGAVQDEPTPQIPGTHQRRRGTGPLIWPKSPAPPGSYREREKGTGPLLDDE
jgi:signal transduction histidine kinase